MVELAPYLPELRGFSVQPWPVALDRLSTLRHSLSDNNAPVTTIRTEREPLFFDSPKWCEAQWCTIPRPLIATAVILLANARVPAVVCRSLLRLPQLSLPVLHPPERTPFWLPALIESIERNWQFLVKRGPGAPSACQIVEWIVRSFPTSKIAVVSENQAECSSIDSWLRKQEITSCHLRGGSCLADVFQRVVGTCYSGHATQDIEQRDFVIFADARNAFSVRGRMLIEHAPKARLIGICREDESFSPWEQDWLFALFGAARLTLAKQTRTGANLPPAVADMVCDLKRFLASRPRRSYAA